MELNDMKYADLRRLAKKLGIKANQKSNELILAIQAITAAGPGIETSDDDMEQTVKVVASKSKKLKKTKSKPDESSAVETTTATEDSQDEDMPKPVEKQVKKRKTKRGGGTSTTDASTAEESQDEVIEADSRKPRGRRGRAKKAESKIEESAIVEVRQRSSSRTKTPKTTTPEPVKKTTPKNRTPLVSKPLSGTPGLQAVKSGKVAGAGRTSRTPLVAGRRTPLSERKTPLVGGKRTPALARKTPTLAKKSPNLSMPTVGKRTVAKKSPAVAKKSPAVAKKSPAVARKSPAVAKKSPALAKKSPAIAKKSPSARKTPREAKASKGQAGSNRKRKRSTDGKLNSTFDLEDDPPNAKKARPSIDPVNDVTIPRTLDDVTESDGDGDVKAMIGTMRASMSKEEMKEALEAALSKSVKKKHVVLDVPEKSNIPRFVTYVKNKQLEKRPLTPGNKNWNRIHKAQFDKMDSLDDYLKKRKERTDKLLKSSDKARQAVTETHARIKRAGNQSARKSLTRPVIPKSAKKDTENKFVPSVTKVTEIKTNFSAMKPKTPAASRPLASLVNSAAKSARKSTAPAATDADKSLIAKTPKPAFDLKASLSKPLSWKPYTGKLKPMDGVKSMVGKQAADAKESRRVDVRTKRRNAKDDAQMKRRGLTT